ncbi:MAG: hypothetical protein CME88_11335 [Hirschia sp.]|nr:hypothetical protein [Hirschia sp.]MBF18962.1 hypothetical protein [Hirschia sp.]|tara:strand:- start:69 stop:569 length:501 start_codon:yes stop_codon:yes gene_type:complete
MKTRNVLTAFIIGAAMTGAAIAQEAETETETATTTAEQAEAGKDGENAKAKPESTWVWAYDFDKTNADEVEAFSEVNLDIVDIAHQSYDQVDYRSTPADIQAARAEMMKNIRARIEESGLSVERYEQIAQTGNIKIPLEQRFEFPVAVSVAQAPAAPDEETATSEG